MRYIADLHVHSKYAGACSDALTLENINQAAIEKGINIIGTGDFMHPNWLSEIKSKLEYDNGVYKLKGRNSVNFILSSEVCTIFNDGKGFKKVHNCLLAPDIGTVERISEEIKKFGNLKSDGRPMLSVSLSEFTEIIHSIGKEIFVFPAHAWTPWYGVFGSYGFGSLKEAYEDQAMHIKAIETGLSCYDIKTEVLTENGWKKFTEISFKDKVCSLNPKTTKIEFQRPTKIWKYKYKGKMYMLKTKRVDLLVTPNHRLFYTPFASHRKKKIFYLKDTETLFGKSKTLKKDGIWVGKTIDYFELPKVKIRHGSKYYSGFRKKGKQLLPILPWLKFLGFWIAEGNTSNGNSGDYDVVVSNTNQSLLSEMKKLLEEMGFNPLLLKSGTCPQLLVRNFQLFSYLSRFGKSYNKYIPKEIKNLSKEYLSVFFEYYIKGDGHIYGRSGKGLSATTNSMKLRDDLQEIALKMGISAYYKAGIKKGKPLVSLGKGQYKASHDVWVIYFIRRNLHSIIPSQVKKQKQIEKWSNFNSNVYCVTVPNGVIYIRRNGIPIWCGNSDPAMNWTVSALDKIVLISGSDAHSLPKLGREAVVFSSEEVPTYDNLIRCITEKKLDFTVEFFPEEGKYHYDGHRNCGVSFTPDEAKKYNGVCPVCRKKLTMGVMHRVEELADREEGFRPSGAVPFVNAVPLIEIVAYVSKKSVSSTSVKESYSKLIKEFGTEFNVLLNASTDQIANVDKELAKAIGNVREKKVNITPGYDGVFGVVDILNRNPPKKRSGMQKSMSDF